ncbi:sugar ABC transporter ATPase [Bacillus nitratireducens]|uniref:sugar ABC transporter ATPase n=1 Tax=Bacillus nitratireducens TaxID=2026193 RepID=UPI000BEB99FF|nr:sugar ABC transporter ATPase [Bacillus nitratireducens]PEE16389.1 sugar ABC transporter ATPase [Bacillus cereus]MED0901633.1 sugar ABC transporter ATPase [Bacillus nitratireducens]PFH90992.1 sugar ABC transporter ATPase [Bacillus cereus]PFM62008.1 sugar ABC transporter ATPase [Bacillus cereus]PFS15685.1 sugar ABC transporter ATPase [Bacillus cereus]
MIFLFAVYFVFIMTLLITFFLSKRSYKRPFIKYVPTLILFILAFISFFMFVFNNGMGELMIAAFLGIAAIVNGLLLLALKVVRLIGVKGK